MNRPKRFSISSQGRYDHFDTLPYVITPFILHYSRQKSKGIRRRDAKNGKLFYKTAKKELTIPSWCGNIIKLSKANALLAQLDRASGYGPEGQGFESLTARHSATDYPLWRFFCSEPVYAREGDAVGWWVYMLECRDGTRYTGCTDDIPRRLAVIRHGLSPRAFLM